MGIKSQFYNILISSSVPVYLYSLGFETKLRTELLLLATHMKRQIWMQQTVVNGEKHDPLTCPFFFSGKEKCRSSVQTSLNMVQNLFMVNHCTFRTIPMSSLPTHFAWTKWNSSLFFVPCLLSDIVNNRKSISTSFSGSSCHFDKCHYKWKMNYCNLICSLKN